ncbi:DUF397 domain-containing protein [Yinghuangia soli]|uniref:DUF397 domain-containing protein n=1 Tax=Yinghuangia soli TaxID=2908204 RepID=A0AA41Q0E6_9ACTN|nr:DUF397 domain-containing protein [Yinghuangia soli]MCF2528665.1 DUF397 domain-containing protein [Yinghuangia soli]
MNDPAVNWVKSSYSVDAQNLCVEVAHPTSPTVLARDSKLVASPTVRFPADAWAAFLGAGPR